MIRHNSIALDVVVGAAILLAAAVVYAVLAVRHDRGRIDRLQARVACLEHPHGESSIAAVRVGKKFVIVRPAHRTGC